MYIDTCRYENPYAYNYKDQYAVENMLNMWGPKHVVKVCGYFACSGHPKHVKLFLILKKLLTKLWE